MAEHKDYNIMSEHGMTDMEYMEEFGVPEQLVGTPGINKWMINYTYEGNIQAEQDRMIKDGVDTEVARAKATRIAEKSRKQAISNLRQVIERRGY